MEGGLIEIVEVGCCADGLRHISKGLPDENRKIPSRR
jgi:hypothetical protein